MHSFYFVCFSLVLLCALHSVHAQAKTKGKRSPNDYTDDDINRLFEEWEDNDEDILPEDERHDAHLRRSKAGPGLVTGEDPDKVLASLKKGQPTVIHAYVGNNPTKKEIELVADIWFIGLKNALFDVYKFRVEDNRVVFVVEDGSLAFDIKNFLVQQRRCEKVQIDNHEFPGKAAKRVSKNPPKDL